jgi:hypothetical protein
VSPKKFKDFEDNLHSLKKESSISSYLGSPETTPSRSELFNSLAITPLSSYLDDFPQSPLGHLNHYTNNISPQNLRG